MSANTDQHEDIEIRVDGHPAQVCTLDGDIQIWPISERVHMTYNELTYLHNLSGEYAKKQPMLDSLDTIGGRIKKARRHARMSQKDLADRVGISVNSLCRYEKDSRVIDAATLAKIVKATHSSANWLLMGTHTD